MKRLRSRATLIESSVPKPASENLESQGKIPHDHLFESQYEIVKIRKNLLEWYDANKRNLQWRELSKHSDPNIRAYSVLVSEIMLQQTQVATVKSYYSKWIEKWPDVQSLSKATLDEVNTVWSGLGYYSRGRRLYEAACKVVNEMDGVVPTTSTLLEKSLPGVGRYTACAIASIAFTEPVGVVDGNVIRVLTRLRAIGADVTRKNVVDLIWQLSNDVVDPQRPGDFNQALMELGATVYSVKSPSCDTCPLATSCRANLRTKNGNSTSATLIDIEDVADCLFCLPTDQPWNPKDGVTNYPRKTKKAAAKIARNVVFIFHRQSKQDDKEYLLWQRPASGLLANLWEFPSLVSDCDSSSSNELASAQEKTRSVLPTQETSHLQYVTDVFHQFSHISQTYAVYSCAAEACEDGRQAVVVPDGYQGSKWLTREEIANAAISTAMKKVFRAFAQDGAKVPLKRKRKSDGDLAETKKQTSLRSFFKSESQ